MKKMINRDGLLEETRTELFQEPLKALIYTRDVECSECLPLLNIMLCTIKTEILN